MKSKSKGFVSIILVLIFGFCLLFPVNAEEKETEVNSEEETSEVETIGAINEEEVEETINEEEKKEESIFDDISYEKLKDYKIDFSKISKFIDKELTKLKSIRLDNIFGNYNSFYEAVGMSKENVLKTIGLIFVIAIVLYIIMRIFKITKK